MREIETYFNNMNYFSTNEVAFNFYTRVSFYPSLVIENSINEIFIDYEFGVLIDDYEEIEDITIYTETRVKPYQDTLFATIATITNSNNEFIENIDLRVPSYRLNDQLWDSYFELEIGSSGSNNIMNVNLYDGYDNNLASTTLSLPLFDDVGFDSYDNPLFDVNVALNYWGNYISDYYNSALINEGYNEGYTDGYNSGYNEGYNSGYNEGYNSGYNDGEINRPLTTFGTVIKVISDNASDLLQTEILPNFTISNIIFIPVIFSLLGIVFKFFRR